MTQNRILIVGGGAAGFFSAITAKESNPTSHVTLLESSARYLSKVKISGGGRCNVTHHCFEPKELVKNYPRGSRELLGPFNHFQPLDMIEWLKKRGVSLKTEKDGRMFPTSNSSETIIECFLEEAKRLKIQLERRLKVTHVEKKEGAFLLHTVGSTFSADKLILATGSAPIGWEIAAAFGHTIVTPVPSLFTFNIQNFDLKELAGITTSVCVKLGDFEIEGPLLITHWGFSGPACLKLSAFAARYLAQKEYFAPLIVDWTPQMSEEELYQQLLSEKQSQPQKKLSALNFCDLPKNLWKQFTGPQRLQELSNKSIRALAHKLKRDVYQIKGKTTHKEEFVTSGGIKLSEVNFKTMESRLQPYLHFCGEILDIDGVTGGFNFQNAWTTGWIAGKSPLLTKD